MQMLLASSLFSQIVTQMLQTPSRNFLASQKGTWFQHAFETATLETFWQPQLCLKDLPVGEEMGLRTASHRQL